MFLLKNIGPLTCLVHEQGNKHMFNLLAKGP